MTNLMNGMTLYLPAKHAFSTIKKQVGLSSFQKKSPSIKLPAVPSRRYRHQAKTLIHLYSVAKRNPVSRQIAKEVCIRVDLSACLFSGCMQAGTDGTVKGARDGFS